MQRLRLSRFLISLFCLALPLAANAELVVIVNPSNPIKAISAEDVSDFYLGRARYFRVGDQLGTVPVLIYDYPADSPMRETFFALLNGMSIRRINAYWARLRFSGQVLPPVSLADSRTVLATVSHDPNAMGYVNADALNGSVKVVLRLKE